MHVTFAQGSIKAPLYSPETGSWWVFQKIVKIIDHAQNYGYNSPIMASLIQYACMSCTYAFEHFIAVIAAPIVNIISLNGNFIVDVYETKHVSYYSM